MRIAVCLFLIFSLILSSCKKEDEDNNPSSISGCTDPLAMNYNASATSNNGSCIYAYSIAQGTWNITPDCEEYTIPVIGTTISLNDQLPDYIDIQGSGDNILYIDLNGTQINGNIDYMGNINVPKQTVGIDMGFGPMDIDIEGSGFIESEISGSMNLTYSFDIEFPGLPIPISESLDCTISLYR